MLPLHLAPLLSSLVARVVATALLVGPVVPDVERVTREAWAMGTRVRIVVEGDDRASAARASEAALLEIERVGRVLSTWDTHAELARANRAALGQAVRLTPELGALLTEATAWSVKTGGTFDPAVGSLIDAWGVRGPGRTPTSDELARALAARGVGALTVGAGGLTRHTPDAWIDSGGFGKGAALRSLVVPPVGIERMLVDLGGQVWAAAPSDAPWSVDVAHPAERERSVARLLLHGASAATSGDSERPGHVLDPRTGRPVTPWGSVTVVSADPLEADVLSTALFVMGPQEGLTWARAHGAAALFLERSPDGLRSSWTEAMAAWLDAPIDMNDTLSDRREQR